jgi:hypothetical protein
MVARINDAARAAAFDDARRDMLSAWRQLCLAGLGQEAAAEEAKATASAMRQIAAVEGRP